MWVRVLRMGLGSDQGAEDRIAVERGPGYYGYLI
jgi:hypothetical protein